MGKNRRDVGRVLVVEADDDLSDVLGLALEEHDVRCVSTSEDALGIVPALSPDVVIVDVRVADATTLDLARRVSELAHDDDGTPASIILLSSMCMEDLAIAARALGAVTALRKPFSLDELLDGVASAVSVRRARESGVFPRKAVPRADDEPMPARTRAS
jgi:DNA-binding response OmpR family regulator